MPTCRPVSVLELSQAVAESTRSGQRVRAVGSLTAFSNVAQTDGLVGPYTYSDMTGAGLGLVTNPPQG